MQALIAAGGLVLLFSLFRLDVSQLTFPLFLLTLLAFHLSRRFDPPVARDGWSFPYGNACLFTTAFLFDAEAAVLAAWLVTLSTAMLASRGAYDMAFRASLSALALFFVLWTLRVLFGPVTGHALAPLRSLDALFVAALALASAEASVVAYGWSYRIDQSVWRTWRQVFTTKFWGGLAAAGAALFVAACVDMVGVGAVISVAAAVALLAYAIGGYFGNGARGFASREKAEGDVDRFRSAFDSAAIGMALVSTEGRWLQVNGSLCRILGYAEDELLATDFLSVTHPEDLPAALTNIGKLLKGRAHSSQMEKRYLHKEGREVWVNWSVSLVRDRHSMSAHLIFQVQDVTDRKRAEQQLQHDAFHDALTGLPNRALFMDHLRLAVARSARPAGEKFAVLYLDLDRFKLINDSLGHATGDQLLVRLADRLKGSLRAGDTVARLGGDEFTVLIEGIVDEKEAVQVAERVQRAMAMPFNLNGREVFTTASIGIAPSSTGYERAEDILRDADTAMYRAKANGKARYEVFDRAMHARATNLLQMETDLRRALDRGEFAVHYQPIVSLADFRPRGFEALVRWRHPTRGFIPPAEFIPVAEETGMILPIGEWVLLEACRQMRRWQQVFPSAESLFISVNLSGRQFGQDTLTDKVAGVLRETGVRPQSLKLEITESVVMENVETAAGMLRELRALGVRLAIDDFGTGYSSLSYLHRFPIDTLKIDRSFVTRMSDSGENAEIVRTIIMLAQVLGMDVVAEGVETGDQLALLRALGCETGQGYYFSRPAAAADSEKILAETYGAQAPPFTRTDRGATGERAWVA